MSADLDYDQRYMAGIRRDLARTRQRSLVAHSAIEREDCWYTIVALTTTIDMLEKRIAQAEEHRRLWAELETQR